MANLRILFTGSGEFGAPALRALLEAGHDIVQVISQPDRPAGRGQKLTPTPISRLATTLGLPLRTTGDINAESLPPADLMVVIAFGQKIAPHIVDHPRLGSINLHASLLPLYRGAAPINWAILRGETLTGNSIIRLAQRMDAGAILGQSRLSIGELETAGELHDRLADDGASLLRSVVDALSRGEARETAQDDSQATLAPKLARQDTCIDWNRPADEIARRIRGLHPWPGCHARLLGSDGIERGQMTLVRARPGPTSNAAPGVVDAHGFIGAGDGRGVELIDVHPQSKRIMPLSEYRKGHAWEAGLRLESLA